METCSVYAIAVMCQAQSDLFLTASVPPAAHLPYSHGEPDPNKHKQRRGRDCTGGEIVIPLTTLIPFAEKLPFTTVYIIFNLTVFLFF